MSIRQEVMKEDVATLAEAEKHSRELNARIAELMKETNDGITDEVADAIAEKKLELARCEKIINRTVEELKRLLVPDPATPWTMFVCEVLGYSIFVTDDGELWYIDGLHGKRPGEAATADEFPKLQPLYELPQRWRKFVILYIKRTTRHAVIKNLLQSPI